MSAELHKSLRRYLRKARIDPETGPTDAGQWTDLLARINRSFHQSDQDRYLLERSLDISGKEMNTLHEDIAQDQQRLSAILASLPQAVVYLDPELNVESANPSATRLMAVEANQPFDRSFRLTDHTGRQVSREQFLEALAHGRVSEPDGTVITHEAEIPCSWQLVPVSTDGVMVGAACVLSDLRELKNHERELRTARVEAEVAVKSEQTRARFLANMSHELRTPLNAILGYSEMVQEELADHDALADSCADLGRVLDSARHLLHLINDLLDISKVDAGKLELVPELFSLAEILRRTASTTSPLVSQRNNRLVIDCPQDVRMYQDPTRLTQTLLNLVSNAAKFTDEGVITIRARSMDDEVFIDVIDTGAGIPEDRFEALFDAFVQADKTVALTHGGTGLGLSLSQRFAHLMGGEITVRSTLGQGSTFTIQVPIDVRSGEEVPESNASRAG